MFLSSSVDFSKMTNLALWDRQVEAMFAQLERQVDDAQEQLATIVFDKVIEYSPMFTGLYASNHEIHLGKGIPYLVNPGEDERESPGQFFSMISENRNEQVENLSARPLPTVVQLGTGVSYAEQIEDAVFGKTGNAPVYHNAWQVGVMIFNQQQRASRAR